MRWKAEIIEHAGKHPARTHALHARNHPAYRHPACKQPTSGPAHRPIGPARPISAYLGPSRIFRPIFPKLFGGFIHPDPPTLPQSLTDGIFQNVFAVHTNMSSSQQFGPPTLISGAGIVIVLFEFPNVLDKVFACYILKV